MNRFALTVVLCLCGLPRAHAAAYFQQASLPPAFPVTAGMDRDSLGNLYVLGRPNGSGTYWVAGFQTPEMTPIFSFDTGVSSPVAYAVEASGVVDVVEGAGAPGAITLRRFQNTGAFLGQTSYSLVSPYYNVQFLSATIDKTNSRLYLADQYWVNYYCLQCIGCGCAPSGTKGFINQYDFSGNLLRTVTMPGISASAGSCYTPSNITTSPQGDIFIADNACARVLKYSMTGSLLADWSGSSWTSGYQFFSRGMWTDPQSALYINQPVCGPTGCQPGVVKTDGAGNVLTKLAADAGAGCAWDERIMYLGGPGAGALRRFVFNTPPSVPAEIAPIGPVLQHSSSALLSWQLSSDAEGDQVSYTVSLGTAPAALSPLGSVQQQSLETAPLAFETTYYWQVVALDIYQGLPLQQQQAPVVSFRPSLRNSAPSAFGVVGGTGTAVTRNTSLLLSWQKASDPDGDPVVYDVYSRAEGQPASLLSSTAGTAQTLSGLTFGTTYYWSVRARDPYGASTAMSGGQEQSYYAVFANTPPAPPIYVSTAATFFLHTPSPAVTLTWGESIDPDGDPVAYRLEISTSGGPESVFQGMPASLTIPVAFDTTYFWRVAAADPFGGASTGPFSSFVVRLANRAPESFAPLSGTGSLSTRATTQVLSWEPAVDQDGDPILYGLRLSTEAGYTPLVRLSTATSFTLAFQHGATYYWSVEAYDGLGATTTIAGSPQTFLPVFLNEPPSALQLSAPFKASPVVNTMERSVSVSWERVTTPQGDPITYTVYLGDSADSLQLLARITQDQDAAASALSIAPADDFPRAQAEVDGTTIRLRLSGLDYYRAYFLRVVASNPYGASTATPLETFSLSPRSGFPKAYNYPNPFSPSRGGTRLVFNAPPSGYARAVVSVYSELQDLLFRHEYASIPPGISEVAFEGRDRYGRPFFNGSYICHVRFEGPEDKETFYLMVVK